MKRTPAPSKPASRIIASWVCSGHSASSARRRSIAQSDCRMRSCCAIGYVACCGIAAAALIRPSDVLSTVMLSS
jgi:hypothetical protein